jgi:hypothetical protein
MSPEAGDCIGMCRGANCESAKCPVVAKGESLRREARVCTGCFDPCFLIQFDVSSGKQRKGAALIPLAVAEK